MFQEKLSLYLYTKIKTFEYIWVEVFAIKINILINRINKKLIWLNNIIR